MAKHTYSDSFVVKAVSCFAVFTDGKIDVEASVEKFKTNLALVKVEDKSFVRNVEFDKALNELFEKENSITRKNLEIAFAMKLPTQSPKVLLGYIEDSIENERLLSVRGRTGGFVRSDAFKADIAADNASPETEESIDIAAE